MTTPAKRWLTLAAACLGLTALGWTVSSTRWFAGAAPIPRFDQLQEDDSASAASSSSTGIGSTRPWFEGDDLTLPSWLVNTVAAVMYGLLALAALAVIAYLLRRFLTTRPTGWDLVEERAATQPDTEELRAAVHAGLSDIDAGGDPRKAVIACWLRLERAAATAGLPRLESETPTDLVTRVLSAGHVEGRALRDLAEVYQRARYAHHDIALGERDTARAALARVDAQLTHSLREPS